MGFVFRIVDECDLGAIQATVEAPAPVETSMHRAFITLRPHFPASYYPHQGYRIVLTPTNVKHLVDLLERVGLWPIPECRIDAQFGE